jgi:uncharacterized protein with HEPN domain
MSRRETPLLVEDIWEAIEKIERYVAGLDHDNFIKDDKTIDSVVRNLEIIGEAANRLPENFKVQHSEIEWRKIIGPQESYRSRLFQHRRRDCLGDRSEGSPKLQIKAFTHPHVTDSYISRFWNYENVEVPPGGLVTDSSHPLVPILRHCPERDSRRQEAFFRTWPAR